MPEHEGGRDAGDGGRQHDPEGGLQARRAERERAVTKRLRNRPHRVLAERGDIGDDHDPHDDAGAQDIEARQAGDDVLQQRRHEQQGEKAVDDRGNAAEQFQHRLDDLAHPRRSELAQIHGGGKPERTGDAERDHSC